MSWPSKHRAAQIAIGLLLVIVVRSLGEFLRLYDPAAAHAGSALFIYIIGAMIAAGAAIAVLILHAAGRNRLAVALTGLTILGLLVYKIVYTAG